MNASIVRRFARYHNLDWIAKRVSDEHPEDSLSDLEIAVYRTGSPENYRRLIGTLTRIEDAEALLEAAALAYNTEYGKGFAGANTAAARWMMRKAGVDPDRWIKVVE